MKGERVKGQHVERRQRAGGMRLLHAAMWAVGVGRGPVGGEGGGEAVS